MPRYGAWYWIQGKDGEWGKVHAQINCKKSERPATCSICGFVADYLCDYPVGENKTCDAPMCIRHRNNIGEELDYCNTHSG